jgi:dihydroorotate dehydrogenase
VVKIAPDLDGDAIAEIARTLATRKIDGVIATNTTTDRKGVASLPHAGEAGGLSGRPLRDLATTVVRALARELDGALPIIGVGGIFSGDDAREKISVGATLVQIYTGLIYRGPGVVAEIAQALADEPVRTV